MHQQSLRACESRARLETFSSLTLCANPVELLSLSLTTKLSLLFARSVRLKDCSALRKAQRVSRL
jgi:hypothetical protein